MDNILQSIIKSVVQIAAPDKIILFGSHATGQTTHESDYDILVLKKKCRRKFLLHKLYRTGLNVNASVDILVNTPVKYDKLKKKWFFVYNEIAKHGKVVYEK